MKAALGGSPDSAGFLAARCMWMLIHDACNLPESKWVDGTSSHAEQMTGMYGPSYQDLHFPRRFQNFLCVSVHWLRKRKAQADVGGAWWTTHSEPLGPSPAPSPSLDGEVLAWDRGAEVKEGLLHVKPHQRRRRGRCEHFGNSSHAKRVSAAPRPNPQGPPPGGTAPSLSGVTETMLLDRCCDLWTKASPPPRQRLLRV